MFIPTNEFLTPITDELLELYPLEVLELFIDCVTNILYIKWLISPTRTKARDLPRDEKGRIIVDLEHPHVIEDADYFRLPALHFMKHGCYTFLKPNSNPHSEYKKFWNEEIRRIREGYVRLSDGEWVTGYCYWFLNYNPMIVNFIQPGKKKMIRKESMPFFFEGVYLRFHYLQLAREQGKHAIELAKRGAHPYFEKVLTPDGLKLWGDILIGDILYDAHGGITKVTSIPIDKVMLYFKISFNDGRFVHATNDHLWKISINNTEYIANTETINNIYLTSDVYVPTYNEGSGKVKIIDIKFVGEGKCKCVTVDAEDELYLIGDHIVTHNCAKSYSLSSIMTHNLILGEDEELTTRRITVLAAYQKEYLKDDKDGTFSKFKPSLAFIRTNTPFPRLMLKNSPNEMTWQMGYKDEMGIERGNLNQVLGVSVKDDPDKVRGKRGWILFEEMGTFSGLLATYDTTRKSVEEGDYTFAIMYLVGTANELESDFSSAKKLLLSPDAYNLLSLNNIYDKPKLGSKKFGFFFPAYINRAGCYNKDGVSDVVKALLQILMARYNAKYNSADPKSVLRVIAEDPITPAEAIVKVKAAYFPLQQLNEHLLQLDQNPNSYSDIWVGDLVFNKDNKVEFKPTADEPIRKFGVANDTPGAIEIYAMPEKNSNGEVFPNRYILGHDPVDNDAAESSSLSSTFVFDLFTDRIVAEFTGRKQFADDNFEIVRKLCLFYNGRCLFESNKKGLYTYMAKFNSTHLLAETPEYLREKQLVKYNNVGSNKYGVNASAAINNYANDLIRQWLLRPTTVTVTNENGEKEPILVPTLTTIKNRALLEELIAFTPEINVDRIRALGMVMLYREALIILYQNNLNKEAAEKIEANYLGKDDYFSRNYDRRATRVKEFNKVHSY